MIKTATFSSLGMTTRLVAHPPLGQVRVRTSRQEYKQHLKHRFQVK